MAGRNKQPLAVIHGKGKSKHLTKEVVKERQAQEDAMKGHTDKIVAPDYLTKKQKKEFDDLAVELIRLKLFSNLDVDGLARYVDSRGEYIKLVKFLRPMKPTSRVVDDDGNVNIVANETYTKLTKSKNQLFNECKAAASDLGLSITSRLKLVIPKTDDNNKPKTEAERRFGGRL